MTKDYDVGYGKPPKAHQFQPGLSGNPKGRPKGGKNLATDIAEEMAEVIQFSESGQTKSTTKQRAMVKALCAQALKGKVPAIAALVKLVVLTEAIKTGSTDMAELSEEDAAILDSFLKRAMTGSSSSWENGHE